jgi:uncharacterized repeat protein (TIGR01451 family)
LVDDNGNGLADAGEVIDYSFTAYNTGTVTLTDLTLSDPKLEAAGSSLTCPVTRLEPGDQVVCQGSLTVTQADVDGGVVANTATATANPPQGSPVTTQPSTDKTPTDQRPGLLVSKTGQLDDDNGNRLADVGETIDYSFSLTNSGRVTLTDVSLDDPKLTAAGVTPTCPDLTSLRPGVTVTCQATYTVTQADVDAGQVTNQATATAKTPDGDAAPPTSSGSNTNTNHEPGLDLVKQAQLNDSNGNDLADVGETIDYRFVLTNSGNLTLTELRVNDPMTGSVTCPTDPLAPGQSATCQAVYTVTQADVDAGSVKNAATADGRDPSGQTVPPAPHQTDTPTNSQPGLTLEKQANLVDQDGDGLADVGELIAYNFTLTNTGTVTLTEPAVSDPRLETAGISVSCPAGPIAPGATLLCTATTVVTQADVDAGQIVNEATATTHDPSGNPVPSDPDHPATTTTPSDQTPGLNLTKESTLDDSDGDGLADVGETIRYVFQLTNSGQVTLAQPTVQDPRLAAAGVTITCPNGPLAPSASVECVTAYRVQQSDIDAGAITNSATATAKPPAGSTVTPPIAPPSSTTTPSDQTAQLEVAKQATLRDGDGDGLADAGEMIDYRFTIRNTGHVTLLKPAIHDSLLEAAGAAITCSGDTVAPLSTTTCQAVYTVTQADIDAGTITNTATASGTTPGGQTVDSPPGSSTTTGDARTGLSLVKKAQLNDQDGDELADVGEVIDYTLTVTNTGTTTVSDPVIDDPALLAAGLTATCPAQTLAPAATMDCTASYTVSQADVDYGLVANSATAGGTGPHGQPADSPPSHVDVPTDATSGATMVKTATLEDRDDDGLADVGETISYEFTVTNTGQVSLSGVTVRDPGLTGISCPDGDLGPGDSLVCRASQTVTQAAVDAGLVTNTATAQVTTPSGDSVYTPPTTATVTTDRRPSLTTSKTANLNDTNDNQLADLGETIDYQIRLTNRGTVTLSNLKVNDALLAAAGLTAQCPDQTLLPGQDTVCTATYTVTQADIDAGDLTNVASGQASAPGQPDVPSNPDRVITPVNHQAGLTVSKQAMLNDLDGDQLADVGETIDYQFTVTNSGTTSVAQPTISDLRLAAAGVAVTCPDGLLAPGSVMTCQAVYTVTQSDVDSGRVSNSAVATGHQPDGSTVDSPPDDTVTTTDSHPGLQAVKQAQLNDLDGDGLADVGETIDYQFQVTNSGQTTITQVSVDDPLLARSGCSLSCPAGPVAPGDQVTCTATSYTVTQADVDAGAVTNAITASANSDGTIITSTGDDTVTPTDQTPGVSLTKQAQLVDANGDGVANLGETVQYLFAVTNTGLVTVSSYQVEDPQLDQAGIALNCPVVPLAPGETVDCRTAYVVTQADLDAGQLVNQATVRVASPGGPATSTDTVRTPTSGQPGLALKKTALLADQNGNQLADVGETVNYTLAVTNSGQLTVTGITADDPLVTAAGNQVTCPAGPLAPGQTIYCAAGYTVTQADVDAGVVLNSATATGLTSGGSPVTSPPDEAETATNGGGDASLVKQAQLNDGNGNNLADVGETIDYRFTVTNRGAVTLNDLTLDDPMLTAAQVAIQCPVTVLAPNAQTICQAQYTVTQADVDQARLENTATGHLRKPDGTSVDTPPSSDTVTARAVPDFSFDKTAVLNDLDGDGLADAGETIDYQFEFANLGTVTLTQLQVTDPLLAAAGVQLTCPVQSLAPGQTATCAATYTVTEADVAAGEVVNQASGQVNSPPNVPCTGPMYVVPLAQGLRAAEVLADQVCPAESDQVRTPTDDVVPPAPSSSSPSSESPSSSASSSPAPSSSASSSSASSSSVPSSSAPSSSASSSSVPSSPAPYSSAPSTKSPSVLPPSTVASSTPVPAPPVPSVSPAPIPQTRPPLSVTGVSLSIGVLLAGLALLALGSGLIRRWSRVKPHGRTRG